MGIERPDSYPEGHRFDSDILHKAGSIEPAFFIRF